MSLLTLKLFLTAKIKSRSIAGTPRACLNLPLTPLHPGCSLSHHCRLLLIPGIGLPSLTSGLLDLKSPLLEHGPSDVVPWAPSDLSSDDPPQRSVAFSPQGPCLVTALNKVNCACPTRLLTLGSWTCCLLISLHLNFFSQYFSQT